MPALSTNHRCSVGSSGGTIGAGRNDLPTHGAKGKKNRAHFVGTVHGPAGNPALRISCGGPRPGHPAGGGT